MDIAQFGASGAVVAVVLLFLKFMREEGIKRDESYKQVAKALDRLSKNTGENSLQSKLTRAAIKASDSYLRERNGRDNEKHQMLINISEEQLKATQAIPATLKKIADDQSAAIITAVKVEQQHVEHQHIEHEVVKKGA